MPFVQTLSSPEALITEVELKDQLLRFQFTLTKLQFLNQLGISFAKKALTNMPFYCSAKIKRWSSGCA